MQLHATLVAAPDYPARGCVPGYTLPPQELVINCAPDGAPRLAAELAGRWGPGHFTVAGRPLEQLRPGTAPLVSGAVILASAGQRPERSRSLPPPLLLAVEDGPDAGHLWPLARGRYLLGRRPSGGRSLAVEDPALSRVHAEVTVGTDSVTVRDLGSANGTGTGSRGRRGVRLEAGASLAAGDSVLTLHVGGDGPDASGAALGVGPAGSAAESAAEDPISVPNPGAGPRAMVLVGALLGLAAGLVLAAVMGSWLFLVFSALSAVTAVAGVLHGRVKRRRTAALLGAAADRDLQRRQAAWPGPGALVMRILTAAAASGPAPGPVAVSRAGADDRPRPTRPGSRGQHPAPEVRVRIGRADQPARVVLDPAPAQPVRLLLPLAPRLHTMAAGAMTVISGSPDLVQSLLRSILLQLSARSRPLPVAAAGLPAGLAAAARFLPGLHLVPDPAAGELARAVEHLQASAGAGSNEPAVLILGPGCPAAAWNPATGIPAGITVLDCRPCSGPGEIHVGAAASHHGAGPDRPGGEGQASRPLPLLPDGLAAAAFERACRALPLLIGAQGPGATVLPGRVPLTGLYPVDAGSLCSVWGAEARDPAVRLPVPVGICADGVLELDLVRDGPHLLVAGTTGAGKSDFLRALIAGLAAGSSPEDVNFLLVDFKGGAGLGPLAGLPHTAGLLTSLSAGNAARTLTSLNAELRRREALFAAAGQADLAGFNAVTGPGARLPRLVVVVDEFRVLSEEVPGALPELMRIAALGRSLGLHLVLATQRPQGAVSADIRANVSAAVCLRVRSEAESRDLLDAPDAASLPPASPGRGYLRLAAGQPVLFQAGGFDLPAAPDAAVLTLQEFLAAAPGPAVSVSPSGLDPAGSDPAAAQPGSKPSPDPLSCGGQLVAAAALAAARLRLPPARRPVAAPLPDRFQAAVPAERDGPLPLGLLDLPHLQAQTLLDWHPETDGHLALLGVPGSGVEETFSALVAAHLRAFPGRHMYLLDGDGSLSAHAGAHQVGACVRPDDPGRAVRVLRRLASGGTGGAGVSLLVSGWGGWVSALRGVRGADGEEMLADLARGTAAGRPAVVASGGRELSAARFFGVLPNRFFLPAGAGPETVLTWPAMPGTDPLPGRAHCIGPAVRRAARPLLAGFPGAGAGPRSRTPGAAREPEGATAQLAFPADAGRLQVPLPPRVPAPPRVEPLPRRVAAGALPPATVDGAGTLVLPLGLCGDELAPATVGLRGGDVFLVLGRAGSGRSGLLEVIASASASRMSCFRAGPTPAAAAAALADAAAALASGADVLVLADDVERLPAAEQQRLAALAAAGARLVVAAAPGPGLPAKVPAAAGVRLRPLGALLAGTGAVEQDLLGFRPDSGIEQVPGRGWLVAGGTAVQAQFALPEGPGPAAGSG